MSVFHDAATILGADVVEQVREQARRAKPLTENQLTVLAALLDFDPDQLTTARADHDAA